MKVIGLESVGPVSDVNDGELEFGTRLYLNRFECRDSGTYCTRRKSKT